MNLALDLDYARAHPTHALHDYAKAVEAEQQAKQALADATSALLRKACWGKIEKVNWDHTYESDDNGGSYVCTYDMNVTIAGKQLRLGCDMESWDDFDDTIQDDGDLLDLDTKARLVLGDTDDNSRHEFILADLADIDSATLAQFCWLTKHLMDSDEKGGEILFGPIG